MVQVEQKNADIVGSLIVARNFVYVDWNKVDADLEHAFAFLSSIRVQNIQLWATDQVPLRNGDIASKPDIGGLPTIKGEIADWGGLDANGVVATWEKAASVAFNIVGTTVVTIPKTDLVTLVAEAGNPILIAALSLASLILPHNLVLNIGHSSMSIPIIRKAGKIIKIGDALRPTTLMPGSSTGSITSDFTKDTGTIVSR